MTEYWLATDGISIWRMEHEADYSGFDTLIRVYLDHNGQPRMELTRTDAEGDAL